MFKNREFRIRVAKTDEGVNEETTPTLEQVLNPDSVQLIEETGNRFVKNLAITVVAVVAAVKIIDTLSEIAVKKTKSADEK